MAGERWRMPAAVATGGMTVSAIALYAVAALAPFLVTDLGRPGTSPPRTPAGTSRC